MAETQPPPQNLYEFTDNLLSDLTTGSITAEEAFVALEQYGYLRDILKDSLDKLAASLTDTQKFASELQGLVTQALEGLNESLPQLRRELPDSPLPPSEVVARAGSFARARQTIGVALSDRQNHLAGSRRVFIKALVDNWISESRGQISAEQSQAGATLIESSFERAFSQNASLDQALASARETIQKSLPLASPIFSAVAGLAEPLGSGVRQDSVLLSRTGAVPLLVLRHGEMQHPDWFTTILLEQLSSTDAPVSQAEETSTKIAKTAEIISVPPPTSASLKKRGGIFSAFAETGLEKALSGVADGVFLFLGPATQDRVLQILLAKTASRVLADTDALTKRLGETFVDSPLFAQVKTKLQETIASPREGISPLLKTKSLVGDLFTTIVGSPIGERLVGSPREAIMSYLELVRLNAELPGERRILPSALARSPSWQHIWLMGDYFTQEPGALIFQPTLREERGATPGGLLGFLFGALTGLGTIVAAPFYWLGRGPGGGILGLFGRGVEGLLGTTLIGRWAYGARRRASLPTRLLDDMPLMVSLVVIIVIVLLFILPSFLNIPQTGQLLRTTALYLGRERGGPENIPGRGPFPPPDYFDYAGLASREFQCLAYGNGITTSAGDSQQLTDKQQEKIESAIGEFPQLKLMSCALGCPANKINITAFPFAGAYAGYAPSGHAGNIIFYPRAFGFDTNDFAGLLAHELAHNIDWLNGTIFDNFRDQVYCGKLGTYPWDENIDETFAEAVRLYMLGDPLIRSYCGGRAFTYFNDLFQQCR